MASPPATDPVDPAAPPDGKPVSYVDKLKSNTLPPEVAARSTKKAFIHDVDSNVIGTSVIFNGRRTIFLSKDDNDLMAAPFQYALVGKFSHGYPTMQRLRLKLEVMGLLKGFKIRVLDHKHVWIRLYDPNDYARVWMKQTCYFDGFPMRVLKWTSEFNPNEESSLMPIWIKVFGLRPHWFHRNFLYHIVSLIGKPLKLDEATMDIANPMVARMCMEVNVLEKLQPDIPIQINGKTMFFKVKYEGIPQYCKLCHHRGHMMAACYLRKENNEEEDTEKRNQEVHGHEEDLRIQLNKTRGKEPTGDSRDIEGDSSNVVASHNLQIDMGLEINKILSESTSATNAQNTIPETIMQEIPHTLHANLTRPQGLCGETRKVEIDGKKYSVLGLDSPSNSRVLEFNKEMSVSKKGYLEELCAHRELAVMESSSLEEGMIQTRVIMNLGDDVIVPDNGGKCVDSEETETDGLC
ncbi:hypothetical protein BUALT_Bualt08G0022300 [Buddleja alternifolia]|uniref:DUF4283 domain-containing protein n=1 Tax=Buddleja alternifolia TaxID=168488 RepID=A0AAV6XDW8_9LAMI|nr:hypothetical protein BUALT_Bualt08G0022300 [Buddleja alternifolia]